VVQKFIFLCNLTVLFFAVGCASHTASSQEIAAPTVVSSLSGLIVLGDISDDPSTSISDFQPLADYLAVNLSQFGIGIGDVKIAPNMETMISWMQSGEVDLYFDSPYPALLVSEQSNARPILRRWKGGEASYHAVFFSRADSNVNTVADLQGKITAFDKSYSTSGYLLPMAYLVTAGFTPVEKAGVNAVVADEEIGYVFSTDDENTIQWVISNRVAAGVTDSLSYMEIPEVTREQLTILAETDEIPRQLVVARDGLDAQVLTAIETILIEMDETEAGQHVLKTFKTSQFDHLPEGADAALTQMRGYLDTIR
jgi:phosphonate transport system substrate-binding protein